MVYCYMFTNGANPGRGRGSGKRVLEPWVFILRTVSGKDCILRLYSLRCIYALSTPVFSTSLQLARLFRRALNALRTYK